MTVPLLPSASSRYGAELDSFVSAYVECAIWSSSAENGTPLDQTEAELSDCESFLSEWSETIKAGHDFWLSRNGHGAGFFDRGCGELGDRLQEAAEGYSQVDLYIGDDGLIYVC